MTAAFVVIWLICAVIGWAIGSSKGRAGAGLVLGLLLGIIGVIIIAVMQPTTEKKAEEMASIKAILRDDDIGDRRFADHMTRAATLHRRKQYQQSAESLVAAAALADSDQELDWVQSCADAISSVAPEWSQRARAAVQERRDSLRAVPVIDGGQSRVEGSRSGVADELAKLAQLHQDGVLTDEEFRTAKTKLL